jgi:hypothetical protein
MGTAPIPSEPAERQGASEAHFSQADLDAIAAFSLPPPEPDFKEQDLDPLPSFWEPTQGL